MAKKYLNLPTVTINERLAEIPGIKEALETKASKEQLSELSLKVEGIKGEVGDLKNEIGDLNTILTEIVG